MWNFFIIISYINHHHFLYYSYICRSYLNSVTYSYKDKNGLYNLISKEISVDQMHFCLQKITPPDICFCINDIFNLIEIIISYFHNIVENFMTQSFT